MISDRPYRKALPLSHARGEIKRCSGTQFDPKVVEVFMSQLQANGSGMRMKTSTTLGSNCVPEQRLISPLACESGNALRYGRR